MFFACAVVSSTKILPVIAAWILARKQRTAGRRQQYRNIGIQTQEL